MSDISVQQRTHSSQCQQHPHWETLINGALLIHVAVLAMRQAKWHFCAANPSTAKMICAYRVGFWWEELPQNSFGFFFARNLTAFTMAFLNVGWPCLWKSISGLCFCCFLEMLMVVPISIHSLSLMITKKKRENGLGVFNPCRHCPWVTAKL